MTTTQAAVVLKTLGTQTDLCLLGFETAGVAGTASGSRAVDNGLSMFATGGHNTASGGSETKEAEYPSNTTGDKKAHATSASATNNTDSSASKSNITTSTSSSSSSAAIFSPKSAAVALSSLFNCHNTANRPRKVFPEESAEESTTSTGTEATTPSAMTSATFTDPAMETDPSSKSDTSSTIGTCTDAEVAYHPEEEENQAGQGNTMVAENEQAPTESSAAWNGHELAMPMPPTSNSFYNNNGQQLQQQPVSHPHHQSHLQHHHHGAPSPPAGVYFSNYGGPPPPGHGYHPRHPHSHAPPPPSWRHQQQGPWTPMVGKPGHHTATPGATPHQHPHHPAQTRPSGYTMWAHGPGMEVRILLIS